MKLNNLVFVSGPQASGKSTFIRRLIQEIPYAISPETITKSPQFYWGGAEEVIETDFFHRQALKHAQRAFESYEYFIQALKHPEKLIIGDRCIYDSQIYREMNIRQGWLTREQDQEIGEKLNILNRPEVDEPYCIVLNPGFETCLAHLEKRWEETGWIKFRETDTDYLRTVCECFEDLQGQDHTFYIGQTPNKETLENLKEWIEFWFLLQPSR